MMLGNVFACELTQLMSRGLAEAIKGTDKVARETIDNYAMGDEDLNPFLASSEELLTEQIAVLRNSGIRFKQKQEYDEGSIYYYLEIDTINFFPSLKLKKTKVQIDPVGIIIEDLVRENWIENLAVYDRDVKVIKLRYLQPTILAHEYMHAFVDENTPKNHPLRLHIVFAKNSTVSLSSDYSYYYLDEVVSYLFESLYENDPQAKMKLKSRAKEFIEATKRTLQDPNYSAKVDKNNKVDLDKVLPFLEKIEKLVRKKSFNTRDIIDVIFEPID